MDLVVCEAREQYEKLRKEEQMTKQDEHVRKQVLDKLESYEQLAKEEHLEGEAAFERIKEVFGKNVRFPHWNTHLISWKMHLGTVRRWFLLLQNLTRTIIVFSS